MRLIICALVTSACASGSATPAAKPVPADPATEQLVAAADRSEHDRKLDPGRKPAETLSVFGVKAGMHVADLGAGTGYTTELLARAVGPSGKVFSQDSPHWDGKWLQDAWAERGPKPVMANTTHVMRDWEDPFPPEAKELDLVAFVCAYHDVVAEKSDAHKLDAAVFAALKHGGVFVVIDNSAKAGTGGGDAARLHRIEETVVRDDILKAGFQLATTSDFLRNPSDGRDWNADPGAKDPRVHTQDRFVLKFVKP